MKRVMIGGFLSLIGSIWALAVMFAASNNLVSSWATPPGRFLTTVSQMGMIPIFVIAIFIVVFGLLILAIEFFKREN